MSSNKENISEAEDLVTHSATQIRQVQSLIDTIVPMVSDTKKFDSRLLHFSTLALNILEEVYENLGKTETVLMAIE